MKNASVITRAMENKHYITVNGQDLGYNFQASTDEKTPAILSFGLSGTFCFALTAKDAQGNDIAVSNSFNQPHVVKEIYKKSKETRVSLDEEFSISVDLNIDGGSFEITATRSTCYSSLSLNQG